MTETENARDIFIAWLRGIVGPPPDVRETIWHYTNAAGLRGILESNRLWATDALFLNDAAEVRYGIELMVATVQEMDLSQTNNATRGFLYGLLDAEQGALRQWLGDQLRPFVACFCSAEDLLSQWRVYAGKDRFGGYAIGFTPPGALPAWAQTAPQPLTLRRVIYDEGAQRESCLALLQPLVEYFDLDPIDRARRDSFTTELVNGIAEVATWCKHPAFAEENEWRISYDSLADPQRLPVLHRANAGLLVPYVELDLPRAVGVHPNALPITTIQCSPSEDPDRKVRGVKSLLDSLDGYDPIEVRASTTPARL